MTLIFARRSEKREKLCVIDIPSTVMERTDHMNINLTCFILITFM